jgi:hypothetical protein
MAGTTRYVRAMGRPGSEEAVVIDALNAIVTTLETYRTRVNASASISAGDNTSFQIVTIGG